MSNSKRVQLILTDEIDEAVHKVAKRQAANKSALVRLVLAQWLESEHGMSFDPALNWGGNREATPVPTPTE